jgi:cobalt-zinc-cadmium efflux system outer membrane protein
MRWKYPLPLAMPVIGAFVLAGCRGVQTSGEKQARHDFGVVASEFRPGNERQTLPELTPDSSLSNFLAFALLNSPTVEATYYDWSASVESITVVRSLPDPQLTFQSDIGSVVETIMPGILQEFPGPGKLRARAGVAAAQSQSKYFAFESAALQTAFDLKRAYYELYFLNERLRINRETLTLLADLEQIARAQNEVGKGTLQDVLRAQIERDRVQTDIINLEDSRKPMLASFKAALGLAPGQPDPPVPARLETSAVFPDSDQLLRVALARNPRLNAMAADVRATEADIAVAYRQRVPDFAVGLMADAKASPTVYRPLAGVTLPIWRDKTAAEIAQAKAEDLAAKARLNAAQIALAVDFAEQSFAYREIGRNLDLLEDRLIPKSHQSLEIARAGYLAGTIDFFNLMDTERTLLNFELSAVEARARREIVLSRLSLLIAGEPPAATGLFNVGGTNHSTSTKISK